MMLELLSRSLLVWLIMVVAAILNGITRDQLMTPLIGAQPSLPLSSITLSLLILIITYLMVGFIGASSAGECFIVGFFWLLLTLAFEYLFAHYVLGRTWREINQVFDVTQGNLFTLALFVTVISPWLMARIRGMV